VTAFELVGVVGEGLTDWEGVACAREEAGRLVSDEFLEGGGGRRGMTGEEVVMELDLGGGRAGAPDTDIDRGGWEI